jgi:hypothetical protein
VEILLKRLQNICNTIIIKQLQRYLGKVYLYGSSITDTYYDLKFHDLDLIVDVEDTAQLENLLNTLNITYTKNKYDGYRFKHNGIEYDVWNLKDTASMTLFNIEPTLDNLLTSCMFSTQSVYYDTNLRLLYFNNIWDQTINTKVIDLVSQNTLFPEKLKELATKYSRRYKMSWSRRLCQVIKSNKDWKISKVISFPIL